MNKDEQKNRKHVMSKRVGGICKYYRISTNIKVIDISRKTGYSTQLIYQFEKGNTNNMIMLFDCYFNMMSEEKQQHLLKDIVKITRW